MLIVLAGTIEQESSLATALGEHLGTDVFMKPLIKTLFWTCTTKILRNTHFYYRFTF